VTLPVYYNYFALTAFQGVVASLSAPPHKFADAGVVAIVYVPSATADPNTRPGAGWHIAHTRAPSARVHHCVPWQFQQAAPFVRLA